MKEGILIVSFGTTYLESREKNIEGVVRAVKGAYHEAAVYQAYTSGIIRKKLKERDGIIIPDTEGALKQMRDDGVSRLLVLPTHIIDGIENNRMKEMLWKYKGEFEEIRLAGPLLYKKEDYEEVAKVLFAELGDKVNDGSAVFMGHGTSHEADSCYADMEAALRSFFGQHVYIATVEGSVIIDDITAGMKRSPARNRHVLVSPFMLVAGDHAVNDMAGNGDGSFSSVLKREGYDPECLIRGLGEYEGIRSIYLRHLREAELLEG